MNVLIVVPPEKLEEGQNILANHRIGWVSAGKEIFIDKSQQVQTRDGDTAIVFTYPIERKGCSDVKGQSTDVLMVHLDLVCRRDWRQLEEALLATVMGAKGFVKVYRSGEFKVYAVEAEDGD